MNQPRHDQLRSSAPPFPVYRAPTLESSKVEYAQLLATGWYLDLDQPVTASYDERMHGVAAGTDLPRPIGLSSEPAVRTSAMELEVRAGSLAAQNRLWEMHTGLAMRAPTSGPDQAALELTRRATRAVEVVRDNPTGAAQLLEDWARGRESNKPPTIGEILERRVKEVTSPAVGGSASAEQTTEVSELMRMGMDLLLVRTIGQLATGITGMHQYKPSDIVTKSKKLMDQLVAAGSSKASRKALAEYARAAVEIQVAKERDYARETGTDRRRQTDLLLEMLPYDARQRVMQNTGVSDSGRMFRDIGRRWVRRHGLR